jgi:hypothetical protein
MDVEIQTLRALERMYRDYDNISVLALMVLLLPTKSSNNPSLFITIGCQETRCFSLSQHFEEG